MPNAQEHQKRRRMKWLVVGGLAVGILLIGATAFFTWRTIAESRRKARAEEAVHTALKQWCSDEPLDQVRDTKAGDFFDEFYSRVSTAPRPSTYQISKVSWVRGGAYGVYEVPVTLTFAGGPETRLYEVEVHKQSGKCSIKTKSAEDTSGTESHARSVLQAWLDCWVAGEDMATFKRKNPEADAKMTADVTWASLSSAGKRLVRYEVTSVTPAPKGFRFVVTATIEVHGTPETKILRYTVYKDRVLSGGRWCVTGD